MTKTKKPRRTFEIPLFPTDNIKSTLISSSRSLRLELDVKNTGLNDDLLSELTSIISWLQEHIEVRSVLLVGSKNDLCSGMQASQLLEHSIESLTALTKKLNQIIFDLFQLPQTIIMDLGTHAQGLGLELSCAADLRIANEHFSLNFNYLSHGLIPNISFLKQVFSHVHLRNWLLSGEKIKVPQLLHYGFLAKTYTEKTQTELHQKLLEAIYLQSPVARIQTKRSLLDHFQVELQTSLYREPKLLKGALQTEDWKKVGTDQEFTRARELSKILTEDIH